MKGILLAGGKGSRLWPITKVISKQLLPVYDKPLIHYSLSTLLLAGINQILIICNPDDLSLYRSLLGDGSEYGIKLDYAVQDKPNGIAESFIIAEEFIGDENVCLILGDNIFFGQGLGVSLRNLCDVPGAHVFAYRVANPSQYGVIEIDAKGNVVAIEEKPSNPKTNLAVPGLYFYDSEVLSIAKKIKPSTRGELEITDINKIYLNRSKLSAHILPRGTTWLDAGTFNSLLEAGNLISSIQNRQGAKISCLEEISFRNGWINESQFRSIASLNTNYMNLAEIEDIITEKNLLDKGNNFFFKSN